LILDQNSWDQQDKRTQNDVTNKIAHSLRSDVVTHKPFECVLVIAERRSIPSWLSNKSAANGQKPDAVNDPPAAVDLHRVNEEMLC